jgi:hypothetical protein
LLPPRALRVPRAAAASLAELRFLVRLRYFQHTQG